MQTTQESVDTKLFVEKLFESAKQKTSHKLRTNTRDCSRNLNIVILTGAGISAESGLQTFRGAGGLWCGHRVEDVATPEAFTRNPSMIHQFYNERRNGLLDDNIKPNPAHEALFRLQQDWPGGVTIVTQNIDNLHEQGGAENVIHMHGEVFKSFCIHCGKKTE